MRVTDIVSLDKRRCKVCTDAGFAFALYKGEARRYEIEIGKELTEGRYREILDTILGPRARERALYLLQSHDRTEQEIRRKLLEGYYPEETVSRAVSFLREYGYVDDLEYGRRYIEIYGQRRSRRRIREDLLRKGLGAEQIAELMGDCQISEQEQIRAFLEKKGYCAGTCDAAQRRRLLAALMRKGYSYENVSRVMGTGSGDGAALGEL